MRILSDSFRTPLRNSYMLSAYDIRSAVIF